MLCAMYLCHKAGHMASTQQIPGMDGEQKLLQSGIHVLLYMGLLSGWPRKNGLASRWEADSRDPREWEWRRLDHVSSSSFHLGGLGAASPGI